MLNQHLIQSLITFREGTGLSQRKFAQQLGYHNSLVSKVENGAQFPTREYIERVIEVCELSETDSRALLDLWQQARQKVHQQQSIGWLTSLNRKKALVGGLLLVSMVLVGLFYIWWANNNSVNVLANTLDLNKYCSALGFDNAEILSDSDPYKWYCQHQNREQIFIDIPAACTQQYGEKFPVAVLLDTKNPWTWRCHTTRLINYQNGWCAIQPQTASIKEPIVQLVFDKELPLDILRASEPPEYFLYYRGVYVGGADAYTLGQDNVQNWVIEVKPSWREENEDASVELSWLWRIDYKCS